MIDNRAMIFFKSHPENWIGEQCSEIEEDLRKNNTKRAYQLVKGLTAVKQGKATTVQGATDTEPMD